MNRFAATLMAIACLLYAAMPAWAAPTGAVPSMEMAAMAHDHGNHDMSAMAMDHSDHSGHTSKPCPHGAEGCVAPFCAACLVIVPEIIFQPLSRIAFSYPAPSPARQMIPHAPALNLPPPRA